MRTSKDTATALQEQFKKIKETIGSTHNKIDHLIDAAVKTNAQNVRKYNSQYLAAQTAEMQATAATTAAVLKETGTQQVKECFSAIELILQDWIVEPVPDNLASVIRTIHDFNVPTDQAEIKALVELAHGSYLGQKLVAYMAQSSGIDTGFVEFRDIERDLRSARSDSITAISAYNGRMSFNHTYIANDLNLGIADKAQNYLFTFAEDFLDENRNMSLLRIEKILTDMTTDTFDISPSKKEEMDKLFNQVPDDRKVEVAARILDNDDLIASLLPLYDKDLYNKACDFLRAEARQRAAEAVAARNVANADLQTAASDLAKSERLAAKV